MYVEHMENTKVRIQIWEQITIDCFSEDVLFSLFSKVWMLK